MELEHNISYVLVVAESTRALRQWLTLVQRFKGKHPSCFAIVVALDGLADVDAPLRLESFGKGANMFTSDMSSMGDALRLIAQQAKESGTLSCPFCHLPNLSEDSLWRHCPLYHIMEPNTVTIHCPICSQQCDPEHSRPFQVHVRNAHGPCGRGEITSEDKHTPDDLFSFALVVCVRDNKMLLVHEFASVGLWLPGGAVDNGETLQAAAIRECKEEAGVDITLVGVLRMQYSPHRGFVRLRIIFFARPIDDNFRVKSLPDYESAGAVWCDMQRLANGDFPLRGSEPKEWAAYLLNGGAIHPMNVLSSER